VQLEGHSFATVPLLYAINIFVVILKFRIEERGRRHVFPVFILQYYLNVSNAPHKNENKNVVQFIFC